MTIPDNSKPRNPISPTVSVGGLVYFPRMLDKIRLHAAGNLPEGYHPNLGKAMDMWTCTFLDIQYDDLVERINKGGSDEEILEWCCQNGRRPREFDKELFNAYMSKKGFRDELSERLVMRKQESHAADRDDIMTFFDFIDFDEADSQAP